MNDTLRRLARQHFALLVDRAMKADNAGDDANWQRYMNAANAIARYVFFKYSADDFAFVVGC
jgi:hypothetical protein